MASINGIKEAPFNLISVKFDGPIKNFIPMATSVIFVPHAIMLLREPMNSPNEQDNLKSRRDLVDLHNLNWKGRMSSYFPFKIISIGL
ncbi:hypothetical protein SDJN02_19585 [Cucurbita argyrosperma subsp. argyrosperma]|nr:hypothetical protein SDJN02_19585 [Cucurbita argyrosperma subsp. argyrosperma]